MNDTYYEERRLKWCAYDAYFVCDDDECGQYSEKCKIMKRQEQFKKEQQEKENDNAQV